MMNLVFCLTKVLGGISSRLLAFGCLEWFSALLLEFETEDRYASWSAENVDWILCSPVCSRL